MVARTPTTIPGPRKRLRIHPERQFSGISAAREIKANGTHPGPAVSQCVPAADLEPMGRSAIPYPETGVARANRVAAASAPSEPALRSRLVEWTLNNLPGNF